jgi:aminoglycoside phosphotransferase (APT) family kinase protein
MAAEELTPTIADEGALCAWLDGEGLGAGEELAARYISGGSQNEIYELRRGELHCAMRIPPLSVPSERDEGIMREWRIIEALDGSDVPHTEAIAACADPTVLGRSFYLMGFVEGWSPIATAGRWPAPFDEDLEARRGLAFQLVEGIGLLSLVDWRARGLADLGRPEGFHERQVDRWTSFWERSRARELPGFDVAASWLRAHRPLDYIPGLMHGDYQFANVMYRHGAPAQLAAIVDWEMGTVGDPKLDLGWGSCTAGRRTRARRRQAAWAATSTSPACPRATRCSATMPRSPVDRSRTSTTTACWRSGSWPSCSSEASSGPATTRSWPASVRSCSS